MTGDSLAKSDAGLKNRLLDICPGERTGVPFDAQSLTSAATNVYDEMPRRV
jgi:hypothetical protein